jgi:hypothetical protein
LTTDIKAGDECGVFGAERVNGPQIALVVEQPADITLDLAPDRFLCGNGAQLGPVQLPLLAWLQSLRLCQVSSCSQTLVREP